MTARLAALAALLAPALASAAARTWPEPVARLLATKDASGKPVFTDERLAALPVHAQQQFIAAVAQGRITSAEHARILLALPVDDARLELVFTDNCVLCHSSPDEQDETTLFTPHESPSPAHLDLTTLVADVHFRRGLSCAGCHGGAPTDKAMTPAIYARWPEPEERHRDRGWIPGFCARCHSDPGFMRNFNPSLPTDQLAKYNESRHGQRLLVGHDSRAAQCISCHGVHGILGPRSRQSMVYPQKIPRTCGACHASPEHMAGYELPDGSPLPTNQLVEYQSSVHGQALLVRGDLGAPACNDCHGNHAAMPPKVASVAQVCRTCHAQNGALFDGSAHKQAFEEHGWPECGKCHGKHAIDKATDAMLGVAPGQLCHDCHAQYAPDDPVCMETAQHFQRSVTELAAAAIQLGREVDELAPKGVDVDALAAQQTQLDDSLRQSRSRIHAFDESDFERAAAPGRAAIVQARALANAARGELRFRRIGLALAIASMVVLALALYLELRRIERS